MTAEQLAQRLDDRFTLLTGGPRTALPRQQTLRAAIDWSYDLLDDDEKRVLRQLSVFVSGCTLDAAEFVCTPAASTVLDALDSLVDKSLLASREGRFSMLETVRQYSRERLVDAGEAADAWARLSRWARAFAASHKADDDASAFEPEHDNLLGALEAATSLGDGSMMWRLLNCLTAVWWNMGRNHLGLARVAAALEVPGPDDERAETFFFAQELAMSVSEWALMADYCDRAVALRDHLDPADVAGLVFHRGLAAERLGDWDTAIDASREAMEMAQAAGDDYRLGIQYQAFASWLDRVGGSVDLRWQLSDRALSHARAEGAFIDYHLAYQGRRAIELGDLDATRQACEAGRDGANTIFAARRLGTEVLLSVAEGDLVTARDRAVDGTTLSRDTGEPRDAATSMTFMAQVALEAGDPNGAIAHMDDALALVQQSGDRGFEARTLAYLAIMRCAAGDTAGAMRTARDAVELAANLGDATQEVLALVFASEVALDGGDITAATTYARRAVDIGIATFHPMTDRALTALANAIEADDLEAAVRYDGVALRWQEEVPTFVWPVDRAAAERARNRRAAALGEPATSQCLAAGRADPAFDRMLRYRAELEASARAALARRDYSSSR